MTQRQDSTGETLPCKSPALPPPTRLRPTAGPDRGRTWQSGHERRRPPLRAVQGDPPQRRGGRLRARKITIAMTKAFLAVNGGQGAASARVRETGRRSSPTASSRALMQAQARRRHVPHRGHPGPGRARADARRRARSRARLCAVPREAARRSARTQGAGRGQAAEHDAARHRQRRQRSRSTSTRLPALIKAVVRRPGATSSPSRILKATLKDLYDGVPMDEVRKCGDPRRAHADREGPGVHATSPRACCSHTLRLEVLGEEAAQARHGDASYAEYFPHFVKHGIEDRAARRSAAPVRPEEARRGARSPSATCSSATSACRRCTTATSCHQYVGGRRFELPQCFFMRVAMGLALNESRPRSARDRVLQRAVDASTS